MDRQAAAEACAEIETRGGNVLEYLAACGCISPWGTWFRLQMEQLGRDRAHITNGKGDRNMKITLEQKKRAVEIALGGESPCAYLKECGSKNPDNMWYVIKKNLEKVDPETWAKLPDFRSVPAEEPKLEITIRHEDLDQIEKDAEALVAAELEKLDPTVCVNFQERIEKEEEEMQAVQSERTTAAALEVVEEIRKDLEDAGAEPRPLRYEGFDVVTIKNAYGQFHYDRKFNILDWTSPEGEEVSYSPECWKTFATEVLPKAMAILGVKN